MFFNVERSDMKRRNKKMYIPVAVLLMLLIAGLFYIMIKTDNSADPKEAPVSISQSSSPEDVQVIELNPEDFAIYEEKTDITESGTGGSDDIIDKQDYAGESESIETTRADMDKANPDDWVAALPAAQSENQIMVVAATGSSAVLSLHNKDADGNWKEIFSTKASIGKNGIGKSREGDHKTPRGSYRFTRGFGIKRPDIVNLPYTQVDGNCFWVDDPASKYYNQFVNLSNVEKDWNSAESLAGSGRSYNYALAINYNEACIPGKGSAIFLHCLPTGGAGCIAVSEDAMVRILKETGPDCLLLIESAAELGLN